MKKILIIKSIHEDGINLFKKNKNFEYEITDNTDEEYLKDKIDRKSTRLNSSHT